MFNTILNKTTSVPFHYLLGIGSPFRICLSAGNIWHVIGLEINAFPNTGQPCLIIIYGGVKMFCDKSLHL